MEKYININNLWKEMQLDTKKEYVQYTNALEKAAYVEKLYGSNASRVKKQVMKWANGDFDK